MPQEKRGVGMLRHCTGIGLVEADCPLGLVPEKSDLWKRGFCDGWAHQKYAEITDVVPLTGDSDYGEGFRAGIEVMYIRGSRRVYAE